MMTNMEWIKSGATGCTFATLFAKAPETVGWQMGDYLDWERGGLSEALLISIYFPSFESEGISYNWTKETVREWALSHGFYEEDTSDQTVGLRVDCKEGKAWVQYFGPDSHVPTRQAPTPMLLYTNKLGKSHYVKVGWKGVLHLAHAWYDKISERVYDLLWERSYKQTSKKIGHAPTVTEAAKTTWMKPDNK